MTVALLFCKLQWIFWLRKICKMLTQKEKLTPNKSSSFTIVFCNCYLLKLSQIHFLSGKKKVTASLDSTIHYPHFKGKENQPTWGSWLCFNTIISRPCTYNLVKASRPIPAEGYKQSQLYMYVSWLMVCLPRTESLPTWGPVLWPGDAEIGRTLRVGPSHVMCKSGIKMTPWEMELTSAMCAFQEPRPRALHFVDLLIVWWYRSECAEMPVGAGAFPG